MGFSDWIFENELDWESRFICNNTEQSIEINIESGIEKNSVSEE
jgi:hypothetical protein